MLRRLLKLVYLTISVPVVIFTMYNMLSLGYYSYQKVVANKYLMENQTDPMSLGPWTKYEEESKKPSFDPDKYLRDKQKEQWLSDVKKSYWHSESEAGNARLYSAFLLALLFTVNFVAAAINYVATGRFSIPAGFIRAIPKTDPAPHL